MIRLQRLGKSKHPSYRLVVSDKRKDTQGRQAEILGIYQPASKPKVLELKKERIAYWLSVGAQTSPTVHNLLVGQGIVEGKKRRSVFISKARRAALDKPAAA
jgi:small subunit ribosomal protein S16